MRFYGLDQVVTPTAAFQKAAKEILATYGGGRVINPDLSDMSDEGPRQFAGFMAGGALIFGAALSGLITVYIFRHVNDEKNTFWKVIGYVGGISGALSALTLLMSSVAAATISLPAQQAQQ
jgi:drug/metabolite transporter (DMT)-like permease